MLKAARLLNLIIPIGAVAAGTSAFAAGPQLAREQPKPGVYREAAKPARKIQGRSDIYIIQLEDEAVATYMGGIEGLKATSPRATGAKRLDVRAPASRAYERFLKEKHARFSERCDQALGRRARALYDLRHAFNGMVLELKPKEVEMIRKLPGVKRVVPQRHRIPLTDVGPQHIGARAIWNAQGGSKGEGVVIAVLDTGINHDHPSFADIGGDGYDHTNPLGAGNYIPGSHCDTVDPSFCNDKLIGAWDMVQNPDDPGAPEDSDGHGSHTTGTAGGNVLQGATIAAPTANLVRKVSGVAPHANLVIYDVCIETCPGSALLAAINQVVIDASALPNGIQALNYSISGGGDPYNDPVELGFLAATAAGVYVSASAGNSGPGASTNGHNGPWVASVAAMTHTREITNNLVGFSSDGSALPDIAGSGLTAGYGPAPIVHASSFPTSNGSANDTDPAQCLEPFPAGTWNGEIVVCDRGTIARVDKGANVLAGGAGGFVLANVAENGESTNADPHFLPAVHVGFTDGEALRAWLASETNTVVSISGFAINLSQDNADIVAGFSSRGPNLALDVIKPDLGAPGVDIMAPLSSNLGLASPEFGFLSGTSMASPHNAGAGALVSAIKDWTPYEIRSAMMMTSRRTDNNRKEDGVTPADPFDVGAGRINLRNVEDAGLVLNETPDNFANADPKSGGDPKTLNLASMQNSACLGECSWTRTVRNVTGHAGVWGLRIRDADGVAYTVTPERLVLANGAEGQFTVHANTTLATAGWHFAELKLKPSHSGPSLHMPVAVRPATSTLPNVFSYTVDSAASSQGDVLTYTAQITNGQLSGDILFEGAIPSNLDVVPGSLVETVSNGATVRSLAYDAVHNEVSWKGTLNPGGLDLAPSAAPFGFFPLASLGVQPFGCPTNCDDGSVDLNVPSFMYNGQSYNQVTWSVNGVLEVGAQSGAAASASNQQLPSPQAPNNVLAPLWTDLDMGADGDGAEWYVAVLTAGADQFTVYEWNNIPLFGDPGTRYSFQIWVQNGTSGNIWFVYDQVGSAAPPSGMTVGVENADGTVGASYYFEGQGTAPQVGADLQVNRSVGGIATLSFQATTKRCSRRGTTIVAEGLLLNGSSLDKAIAVTSCTR